MIVTAGAGQGHAQEGPTDDVDLVVDIIGDHQFLVHVAGHEVGDGQHSRGDQGIGVDLLGIVRLQQVAGDLVAHEIAVGQVLVERLDDPIAVAPGFSEIARRRQLDQIARIGVANHVEPVPPPALAVLWRRQQTIHHPGESGRRLIAQEGVDFLRSRRQADQVEGGSTDQGALVGRSGRRKPLRFQGRQDEPINRSL